MEHTIISCVFDKPHTLKLTVRF